MRRLPMCLRPKLYERNTDLNKTSPHGPAGWEFWSFHPGWFRPEKFNQQVLAGIFHDATDNFRNWVDSSIYVQIKHRTAGPRLVVKSTEDEPFDSGLEDRLSTHRTRFKGGIDCRSAQPPITQILSGLANSYDFGGSGWILCLLTLVVPCPDDNPLFYDQSTDGNIFFGFECLGQSCCHPSLIDHKRLLSRFCNLIFPLSRNYS